MTDQEALQKTSDQTDYGEDGKLIAASFPGLLKFEQKAKVQTIPTLIRQRGNSRRDFCAYKPLRISFLNQSVSESIKSASGMTSHLSLDPATLKSLQSLYLKNRDTPINADFTATKSTIKPFKGLGKHMKIVSHCGESDWGFLGGATKKDQEQTLLQEYYLYKIQKLLYPMSLSTQLIEIDYKNNEGQTTEKALGFFRERTARVAKKCGFRQIGDDTTVTRETYDSELETVVIQYDTENKDKELPVDIGSAYRAQFQMLLFHNYDFGYMNPDSKNRYYIEKDSKGNVINKLTRESFAHNIAVLISEDSKQHFIPYDFDLSTLITQRPRFYYQSDDSESMKKEAREWWEPISTTKKRVKYLTNWIKGAELSDYFWFSEKDTDPNVRAQRGVENIKNFLDKSDRIKQLIEDSLLSKSNKDKFLDWLKKTKNGLKETLKEIE